MKRVLLTIGLALAIPFAAADAVSDFLKVRKANKLAGVVGPEALNTLIGSKVFELRATIQGVVRIDKDCALLLENVDGSSLTIRSKDLPDWIVEGGAQTVRLIVKATRAQEYAELQASMLAAVPEATIRPFDAKVTTAPAKNEAPTKSSSGNSALYGTIGPRGSKLASRGEPSNRDPRVPLKPNEAVIEYAKYIKDYNKRLSDDTCIEIAGSVIKFSLDYKLDPRLIMAVAIAESGFNPNATSHAGAQGLLQLMPGTARGLGVNNSYDIQQNVFGSVKLLAGHLNKYWKQTNGDPEQTLILSLAAYNAGGGAVKKHNGVPPYRETQNYVRKVVGIFYRLIS